MPDAELLADRDQQIAAVQIRVGQGGDVCVINQLPRHQSRQKGFSRSDLARDQHKPLPRPGRVHQRSQRLLVIRGAEKEARIGGIVEREKVQPIELVVHETDSWPREGPHPGRRYIGPSYTSVLGLGGLKRPFSFSCPFPFGKKVRYRAAARPRSKKTMGILSRPPGAVIGLGHLYLYVQPLLWPPDNASVH